MYNVITCKNIPPHIEKKVWKDLNEGVNNDYLFSSKMDLFFFYELICTF